MKGTVEERFFAKVEKSSGCWNWTGARTGGVKGGYGSFYINGKIGKSHRVAYELAYGAIPDGMEIDHICHNRACVRPEHLRLATRKQNIENHRGPSSRNTTSGIRGVCWHARERKWRADIRHEGVRYSLGAFKNIEDAEAAVVAKRLELHTHNDADRRAA